MYTRLKNFWKNTMKIYFCKLISHPTLSMSKSGLSSKNSRFWNNWEIYRRWPWKGSGHLSSANCKTLKNSSPKGVILDMHPSYCIFDFYEMYKVHKENELIRGIVTSYNSIVSNSENFKKKL